MNISFSEGTIEDVIQINSEIPEFDTKNSKDKIEQRLEGRLYLLLVASVGNKKVGYKIGYKVSETEFYSWSGAVRPDYRGRGIGKSLLELQERWVMNKGFQFISVKSMNRFPSMLHLLISHGYQVCGYENKGTPLQSKIIFIKKIGENK
ncbi:GNAT family N-acetyltransferase [Microbulbifer sp. MKSA007]|nr:GNAT family N-acetyltransferase [Microbulbifer sp. MKSA007]